MEALNKPWIILLVFLIEKHTINSVVAVLMITMTHTTTSIPTMRCRSVPLVGNSVVGNSVVGNSVVGNSVAGNSVVGNSVVDTIVTDDVVTELFKGQLLPTQALEPYTQRTFV